MFRLLRRWLAQKSGRMTYFSPLLQVMALIAYLMEHKNNYGPHLIIVPNAVMVNWKAELTAWLPSAKCVYYVGHKDDRARKFNLEVASLQFNVLVTTYEYIMRDRAKLSKVCSHSAKPSRHATIQSYVPERYDPGLSWCRALPELPAVPTRIHVVPAELTILPLKQAC